MMISIGAQWTVLQTTAWVGMAFNYTVEEGSLLRGLEQTFDSEHPCRLCQAIEKGQESEQKLPANQAAKKIELAAVHSVVALTPPCASKLPGGFHDESAESRIQQPDSPPPQAIA